ncbi:protease complex subunit PrcB family protein [Paenibacillus sp. HJGM_3]|uniref:protease complex subunit PrcB family protein n=1 Tax=Paenibacillus sp. HJGM_3 TaxID=3379816 RepID=UPI00385D440F
MSMKIRTAGWMSGVSLFLLLASSVFASENTDGRGQINQTKEGKVAPSSSYAAPVPVGEKVQMKIEKVNEDVNKVTLTREEKPNGGYKIHITQIEFSDDGNASISYRLEDPAKDAPNTEVITQPSTFTYISSSYTQIHLREAIVPLPLPNHTVPPFHGNGQSGPTGRPIDKPGDSTLGIAGKITKLTYVPAPATKQPVDPNTAVSSDGPHMQPVGSGTIPLIVVENDLKDALDKAVVRVSDKAQIYKKQDGKLIPASRDDLKEGMQVEVEFTDGPFLLTYPLQAEAEKVVLIGS